MKDEHAAVPTDYARTLDALKGEVRAARFVAQRRVNTELIHLYWRIGNTLAERSRAARWGSAVLDRLATDLRAEFPEMTGLSRTNLKYMRQFADAWPDESSIGPQAVDQLPWGHIRVILGVHSPTARAWYVAQSHAAGWSRRQLERHIGQASHTRAGAATTNFDRVLSDGDSALAQQITRDPYVLDFLAVDGDAREREIEQALVDRIVRTLQELGDGFAFVGRQVHFDVGGDDYFVDLLFFHVEQLRYVVVELKTGRFAPEHLGQLGFYVALVDDRLRRPQHADTVGLLLVTGGNDTAVRYSLGASSSAVGVANYDLLPAGIREALPSAEALARAVAGT
jgi:predicted nuclease of restriction endonuclease-like (RecB) superfamily